MLVSRSAVAHLSIAHAHRLWPISVLKFAVAICMSAGANAGVGFATARELASLGATVIMAGRNPKRLADAAARIRACISGPGSVDEVVMDLADRASVERAAAVVLERHPVLDILVNNAGIMYSIGRDRSVTSDGFEDQFQTNVIGHTLLTKRLAPALEAAPGSPRVIDVASRGHATAGEDFFSDTQCKNWTVATKAYGNSKLGNMLHARGLTSRAIKTGSRLRAYSLCPGPVHTELMRNTPGWLTALTALPFFLLGKTPLQGASSTLYLCMAPDAELKGGGFYVNCEEAPYRGPKALWTDANAEAFLEAAERMAETGVPEDTIKA